MKLTKETKHSLAEGDELHFSEREQYVITCVIDTGRCVNLTIQDKRNKRTIYGCPSSELYGAEIVKASADGPSC